MIRFDVGRYTYSVSPSHDFYGIRSLPPKDRSHTDNRGICYDRTLHRSLKKIFSERFLSSNGQIKEFLRGYQHNTDYDSIIKPILEQEYNLSRHFKKNKPERLSLLWIAVLGSYEKSAKLLVRSGADVNELFGCHHPQMIDREWTILHVLLLMDPSKKNEQLIRLVTDRGADLKARDCKGQTALHIAVMRNRVEMIKLLIAKGADVNVADNQGMTPLLIALSMTNADELAPLLMKHGADVLVKDHSRQNALHHLAKGYDKHVELARILIEMGVSLDERDREYEHQPIHWAVWNANNELVKLFLDYGVDVNVELFGEHLLYFAAQRPSTEVVKTLLKRGADVDLRTTEGRTALHGACEHAAMSSGLIEFEEEITLPRSITYMIGLLLSAGANVLAEDWEGKTPFAHLASGESLEMPETWLIIRSLALKKICQPSVELKDVKIIERYPELLSYYQKCTDETPDESSEHRHLINSISS